MKQVISLFFVFFLFASAAFSEDGNGDEEDLLAIYGDEEFISIATGASQPISKAPAVASVITSNDILAMGAMDIDDVLETVPGLHVARDEINYNPVYTFRGISADFNPQVLMLINGVPLTNLFQGDRGLAWGGMPVEFISRIEIIRGPGAAIYGADAFAGVINIFTKKGSEIDGISLGARAGTFNTKSAWIIAGKDYGDYSYAFSLETVDTNGQNEKIDADLQSFLDQITVGQTSPVSLAPDSVNLQKESYDVRLELTYKKFIFHGGMQYRELANGAGVAGVLDSNNRNLGKRWNFDLTYNNDRIFDDVGLKAQISFLDSAQEVKEDTILFPKGSAGPFLDDVGNPLLGFFPDGIIGNPEVYERHYRADGTLNFRQFENHDITLGGGYYLGDVYKVKEEKNFGVNPSTLALILPGDPVVDVSDTPFVFLTEDERENNFVFIQDVWRFTNDWELTAGIRYDHYSDFGDTVNPRLALVWSTTRNLTTKFLYGEAFRAPSFAQTRAINNPSVLGNPELDPEELKSYEIAFDYRPSYDLTLNLNAFYYKWEDIIQFVPTGASVNEAQNAGEQTGHGLEFEVSWKALRDLNLTSNFSWQKSTDEEADADAGNSPEKQFYFRADWAITNLWNVNVQTNWVMDRNRVSGDSRSDIDNYALVDLTVRRKSLWNKLDIALIVKNLFDEDAREPSPNGSPVPSIPNDLPLPGQQIFGEIRYNF